MKIYRHGDVLIAPIKTIPAEARPKPGLVLAQGEVTGHAHRIEAEGKAQLLELGQELFLSVVGGPARVLHEEHNPIELAPGSYRIWRQREYVPGMSDQFVED